MNRFLFVVVMLLVAVAAIGFYRGWFRFSQDDTNDETNFTITVDEEKFRADKEKVQELGHDALPEPAARSFGDEGDSRL